MSDTDTPFSPYSFLKKVLIVVLITVSVGLLVIFVGQAINTLILIFIGLLLGVILRVARDFVHQNTHLPHGLSLAGVVVLFVLITGGTLYLLGPQITRQANTLYDEIPAKWEDLKQNISGYGWGRELARENPRVRDFFEDETDGTGEDHDMTKSILGFFASLAAVSAAVLLIIVIAIYIAAEPKLYTEGFIRLFPKNRRKRMVEIMDEISITIQWWLVGQICSMIVLGTVTTVGLWLLGMPYPLLLGLFTAVMTFIPNLGPIIAAIPTLLLALTESVELAIYVAIFYIIVQCIEGYFITPMIHRRAISVPPVLIITVQFILYYLIGFIGVVVAMPLIACILILIKRLYIEDILNDPLDEPTPYDLKGDNIFE